jgi:hypothetical protein
MAVNRSKQRLVYAPTGLQEIGPLPISARRAPTTKDIAQPGTLWLDTVGNDSYVLLEVASATASWLAIGSGSGTFDSITSTTTITAGTGLTVTAGNVTIGAMTTDGVLTNTAAGVVTSNALADGEILIGSTGNPPVAATITAGAGIGIVNGAGTITISAPGGTAVQYTTDDANTPVPDGGGNVNVFGVVGGNIETSGAIANTISIDTVANPTFSGLVTCDAGITQTAGTATIESDTNAVEAIYLHANGGVNETVSIYSQQGTTTGAVNPSIDISSNAGGIGLDAGAAAADAIYISASTIGGGIEVACSTGGMTFDSDDTISIDAQSDSNFTVTGAFDLTLDSSAGSVIIDGGEAVADAIQLTASDAAGGVTGAVGTGGYILGATNGPFTLTTGTGNISIGTDAVAHAVSIGNVTGATSVAINSGTGGTAITSTDAVSINSEGDSDFTVTGAFDLSLESTLGSISIDAGEGVGTALGLYASDAAGGIVMDAGTGGIRLDSTDLISIDSAAASNFTVTGAADLTLASTLGAVVVTSGEAAADAIQLTASDAAGGATGAVGTGGYILGATNGPFTVTTGTGDISIGADAADHDVTIGSATGSSAFTVDCGTGGCSVGASATAHTTTVGSTNTTSDTVIQSGTGGVTFTSGALIDFTPDTQTAASPAAATTSNTNVSVHTFTGFTTAAGATQQYTINNTLVSATSGILVSISNLGANDAKLEVQRVTPGAGSFTVDTINNGTQALNGNVLISVMVLN